MKINRRILDSPIKVIHEKNFFRIGDSNCRYSIASLIDQGINNWTFTANVLYAFPFVIDTPIYINSIMTIILTAVGGSSVRLGLYRDLGNFYPGQLVNRTDGGALSSATTGNKENTFEKMLLRRGRYFAALCSNGAIQTRVYAASANYRALGVDPTTFEPNNNWEVAYTFGALPGRFPSGATLSNKGVPHFFLKTTR